MGDGLFEIFFKMHKKLGIKQSVVYSRFPHIVQKLDLFYGDQKFVDYLEQDLFMFEPTEGRISRAGFPIDALIELDFILREYLVLFPNLNSETLQRERDLWGGERIWR